jgi:hypothetical protein
MARCGIMIGLGRTRAMADQSGQARQPGREPVALASAVVTLGVTEAKSSCNQGERRIPLVLHLECGVCG